MASQALSQASQDYVNQQPPAVMATDHVYLPALRARGFAISLAASGDSFVVEPRDQITDRLREQIRQFRSEILAELRGECEQLQPFDVHPWQASQDSQSESHSSAIAKHSAKQSDSRWIDAPWQPPHDIDRLSVTYQGLFAACCAAGFSISQFYDCEPGQIPANAQRPYCYLRALHTDAEWRYWPMLADADGVDAIWMDAVEAQKQFESEPTAGYCQIREAEKTDLPDRAMVA
jgi:hypothetical protein